MGKEIRKLTRKQLFDEIWELSVAGVSRKYNLNYSKLREICKDADIPIPTSGYWTRKKMGKDVSGEIVELTGSFDHVLSIPTNDFIADRPVIRKSQEVQKSERPVTKESEPEAASQVEEDNPTWDENVLSFLQKEERDKVLTAAQNIKIDNNARLHKVLANYKKTVTEYKAQLKKAQSSEYYNPRVNKPKNEPVLLRELSDEGLSRALAILNAAFKEIEKLGGTINDDLTMNIRQDVVGVNLAEGQDKVLHELTKQEAKALLEYNESIKNHRWASKPQIRKYDKVYNGKLRIVFGGGCYIRDNESLKLEDRMGDILVSLYEDSERERIAREEREEKARQRAEEERIREENRKRKEREIELTKELVNLAEDYRIATEIRAYIKAAVEKSGKEVTIDWINWAERKADWYDPTVALKDELLGQRDHKKSKDEKDRILNIVRRGWY